MDADFSTLMVVGGGVEDKTDTDGASGLTVPNGVVALRAIIQADGGDARFRVDGTSPTSTEGFFLADGDFFELESADMIENFEWILDDGNASGSLVYVLLGHE